MRVMYQLLALHLLLLAPPCRWAAQELPTGTVPARRCVDVIQRQRCVWRCSHMRQVREAIVRATARRDDTLAAHSAAPSPLPCQARKTPFAALS